MYGLLFMILKMKMKNILIISSVFKPEPVVSARISEEIALALAQQNNVVVLTPPPSRPKGFDFSGRELYDNRYKRVITDSYVFPESKFIGRMRESFSFGLETYRYIRRNKDKIDVIYANTKPLFGIYFTLYASARYGIPVILHIQDIYPESMLSRIGKGKKIIETLFVHLDKILYRKAFRILTISDKMREYISETRNILSDKVEVVRNWQDESNFLEVEHIENKCFTFMFVGSISAAAGVDFLIRSFIKGSFEDCRLIIVGDGSQKDYCKKIVCDAGVTNILFESVLPNDVPSVQERADVLLLPLKKGIGKTASPSKLPAYMLSGKPIIACVDSGCDTDSVITSALCGIVSEAENEIALIAAMNTMLSLKKQELVQMGQNGRKFALANMSKAANLNKIVKIINSIGQ